MQTGSTGAAPIASAEIQDTLARVLASGAFLRSAQLQRLLRFLVEETLAGRGDRLKEYVIGVEVFGRPASYDPRLDSLVRVEARRLRAALDAYYAAEGSPDAVVIDLPKGSYLPAFRRPGDPGADRAAPEVSDPHGEQAFAPSPGPSGAPGSLPVRRRPRVGLANILLGVAVVAAIVAVAGAWLLRSRRVEALTDRDSIVLAGFVNATREPIFDETLKQGLAVELEQSPFLNIVSDRRVSEILKLMGRSPADAISQDLAREVCVRAGSRVMIAGSIARLGTEYVVGLTATNCSTGDPFAHVQAQAASREAVLKALGAAALRLRGRLGESLASIQKFDAPIEDATTSSLEALQAYGLGRKIAREKGSPADIAFYRRAIEIDPAFAVAHAALGVSYVNLGQPSVAADYLEKARQLSGRVSEREKYRIGAYYHHVVTGELEKAREVYDLWRQSYPRDVAPNINRGLIDIWLGEYEKAVVVTAAALQLDPGSVLAYSNLAALYIKLGRPEDAAAVLRQAAARGLSSKFVRSNLGYLAFLRQDTSVMEQQLADIRGTPGDEDALLSQQSDTEAYYGQQDKARDISRRAVESAKRAGAKEAAAGWLVNAALREAEFGYIAEARSDTLESLRLAPGRDVVALAALASARSHDLARAEGLLRDLEKSYPLNTVMRVYWLPTIAAAVETAAGNANRAIEELRKAAPCELASPPPIGLATLYPVYLRGEAYLLAGDGVAAASEFQKILDRPGLVLNFPLHALAWLQLGRARAMSGDVSGARQAYQDFFALWKAADPDIPVLKAAKTEYAKLHQPH